MKTAMIIGAAGGIGAAIGSLLDTKGFSVIASIRQMNGYDLDFADMIVEGDLARDDDVSRMLRETAEETDQIDLWIYAAGDIQYAKTAQQDSENWNRVFNANLFGAKRTLTESIPLLADAAHVMFIGAYTDRMMMPGLSAYTASKSALATYSSIIAKELRGKKVSLIRPAAVDTPFWEKVPFKLPPDALKPKDVAEKVFQAYEQGLTGLVDI